MFWLVMLMLRESNNFSLISACMERILVSDSNHVVTTCEDKGTRHQLFKFCMNMDIHVDIQVLIIMTNHIMRMIFIRNFINLFTVLDLMKPPLRM